MNESYGETVTLLQIRMFTTNTFKTGNTSLLKILA